MDPVIVPAPATVAAQPVVAGRMRSLHDSVAPQRLAFDQQKQAQNSDLAERRFTLAQETQLLAKAQLVEKIAKTRFDIESARRTASASAQAISKLGDIDPASPGYPKARADVLAAHPDALTNQSVREILGKTDQMHISWQGAEQNKALETQRTEAAKVLLEQRAAEAKALENQKSTNSKSLAAQKAFDPAEVGKAGYDINTTIKGLNDLTKNYTRQKQAVPDELTSAITNLTKYTQAVSQRALDTLATNPVTAAPQGSPTPPPASPTPSPTPPPASPTPSPTPPPVAATPAPTPAGTPTPSHVDDFLTSAGVPPAVQAAPSGLPDDADKAAQP